MKEALIKILKQNNNYKAIDNLCGILRCKDVVDCEECPFYGEIQMDELIFNLEVELKNETKTKNINKSND
jgi:hypothetical protein